MTPERAYLQVGAWLPQSRVNGPGNRFVLWLQGCSLLCEGCCNPEFQPHGSGLCLTVQAVFDMILAAPNIEGVTYSGGEPFEQAEALALLSQLCRDAGLTVMAYSGLTHEVLCHRNDPHIGRLLSLLDVLVDGPFESSCAVSLLWRGSRNQCIHVLTDRYYVSDADIEQELIELEFRIHDEMFSITGTAGDDVVRNWAETNDIPR